ncbi:MAG: ComEA family DNA-binding protein [Candidatus Desantisbacteria bacterium]
MRFLTFTRLQQIGLIVLSCTAMLASGIIISQSIAEKRTPSVRFVPEDIKKNTSTNFKPIDINTASAWELMVLPRVGSCTAARIIEYRKQHGGFSCVEELLKIKGIGPKTLEKIREGVFVGTNTLRHDSTATIRVIKEGDHKDHSYGTKTGSVAIVPKVQKQRFPININTASASVLETLPGIGPAKAKAIQDYRNIHGSFQKTEDITMVKGIGEKIFERIRLLIATGENTQGCDVLPEVIESGGK